MKGFLRSNGLPAAGIEGRTDEELLKQGYILYCAGNGGNKATWMRAIVHGTRLGLPVLVLGYAPTRQSDLRQFRIDYIEEFNETKESPIHEDFSYASFSEGEKMRIDLALLFTWREVARFKNSVNTNLLIMDEVFDSSLDGFGTCLLYTSPSPRDS